MKKKKIVKYRPLILLAFGIVFLAAFFLYPQKKLGFDLSKIRSPFEPSTAWDIESPSAQEEEDIRGILSQEYNYLGSGAQCYAFNSADGKYVLKFFKIKHLRPKTWLKFLPLPGLGGYRFKKIDKRILRQKGLFSSYKMAYEDLKKETGLIYIHLNKSNNLDMTVRLYDRMRTCFEASLDEYEFVVQRKAQLVRDRITFLMNQGDKEGAINAIQSLLSQVVDQCKKGFIDRDSGISHNYGFVGDQVIHFDVGRIMRDESAKDPTHYQREILRVGKKLENWIEIHYPNLLPSLEERIDRIIDSSS